MTTGLEVDVVRWTLTLGLVAVMGSAAAALPIVVDGDLTDWGVLVADHNGSTINAFAGAPGVLGWHSEDQEDDSNSHIAESRSTPISRSKRAAI